MVNNELFHILQTKFHFSSLTSDIVSRLCLVEQLGHCQRVPLTLVLPSVGYRKSTLISIWL
jgi:ATP/maltotriose-dependent transcriptional regulator MalT